MTYKERIAGMTPEDRLNYEIAMLDIFQRSDVWQFIKNSIQSMIALHHHRLMDSRITSHEKLLSLAAESRGLRFIIEFVENYHEKKAEVENARKLQAEHEQSEAALADMVEQHQRLGFPPTVG